MVVLFSVSDKRAIEEDKKTLLLEVEDEDDQCSSSTTSSIGKDSDASEREAMDNEENEAQSAYKYDEPLNMMNSLQQLLPVRRGISKFYDGKSKSFMSLADAASFPSVKEIAKPENAYTRRHRNLMAFNHVMEKNRKLLLRSNNGRISKRTIRLNRSMVTLAYNYDSSSSCTSKESSSNSRPPPSL